MGAARLAHVGHGLLGGGLGAGERRCREDFGGGAGGRWSGGGLGEEVSVRGLELVVVLGVEGCYYGLG